MSETYGEIPDEISEEEHYAIFGIPEDDDWTAEQETQEILADPESMAAIEEGQTDILIREGIYAPGDDDPGDHPPTYEEDPSFYGDGITTDDFDNWPAERQFPS